MNPESLIQRGVMKALGAMGVWLLRINAGARGGVRLAPKGTPDLLIVGPRSLAGSWLEVKTDSGKLSPEQVEWHARAKRNGVRVAVVHSAQEAVRVVLEWRTPERKAA